MIKTYLQWVGTSYYATVNDFIIDVREHGLIKRLPNIRTAVSFSNNRVAIFLAHDNGRLRQCLACAEQTMCPLCCGSDDSCLRCKGLGTIECGTGGYAVVDGERWTFLRYVKMKRNHRHEFWKTEHKFGDISWCKVCGGRGQVPSGEVFGFYVPEEYWYVTDNQCPKEVTESKIKNVSSQDINRSDLSTGVYAVSKIEESQVVVDLKREILAKIGDPPVEHIGGFVHLMEPFLYVAKQFRGVKSWEPPVHIDDKVEVPPLEGLA
jgi:hypothetical protein